MCCERFLGDGINGLFVGLLGRSVFMELGNFLALIPMRIFHGIGASIFRKSRPFISFVF